MKLRPYQEDLIDKTLRGRIFDYGWDIERALTEKPVKGKNQYG